MPNRLAQETSPYLLQHAHNPVDWYAWGREALDRAEREDKPILLSIGYAACHWCHVMERESFENGEIAALMNRDFVCIKVDREERPDLDDIYMSATVALSGSGGWPMTVFLTPEKLPFFAGTYFPPSDRWGRPGFKTLLARIAELWRDERTNLLEQATQLTSAIRAQAQAAAPGPIGADAVARAARALSASFDARFGGFGGAPKFPPSAALELLLRHYSQGADVRALEIVKKTLDSMKDGGIYDQLGGGFSRYSVDERWHVPHFEKMLYDNAELARIYLAAHQVTRDPEYARVAGETLDFVAREIQGPAGGYYSSYDADSEGVEGKYYVWSRDEFDAILDREAAEWFALFYDVHPEGNWEGTNVLWRRRTLEQAASDLGVSAQVLSFSLAASRAELLAARRLRQPPACDDKVLTAWNGLMIDAMAEGHRVLGEARYLESAQRAARFALSTLRRPDGGLFRTARAGRAHLNAYLEDYAYLCDALVTLYEAGGGNDYLDAALELGERMIRDFGDDASSAFFHTAADHEALLTRNRDGHDGAIPNPNSVAARALARLAVHFDRDDLRERAIVALGFYGELVERTPRAFATLICAADFLVQGPTELVLVGPPADPGRHALERAVAERYLPNRVIAHVDPKNPDAGRPLTRDKSVVDGHSALYVCRNFSCQTPIAAAGDVDAALTADRERPARPHALQRARMPGRASAEGTARYRGNFAARYPDGYRELGRAGALVSALGFAGDRLDGRAEHKAALTKALETGINLVETSNQRGDGRSERAIGSTLRALVQQGKLTRDEIVIVSRVGYARGDNLELVREREKAAKPFPEMLKLSDDSWHSIHPEWLEDQLNRSLARLELETLDVCLLHDPEYSLREDVSGSARSLDELRERFYERVQAAFVYLEGEIKRGRIACYGVSTNTAALARDRSEAIDLGRLLDAARLAGGENHRFCVLQVPLNLIEADAFDAPSGAAGESLLALAAREHIGVLVGRPLNATDKGRNQRLVDPPVVERALMFDFARNQVAALEREFRDTIAPSLRMADGGIDTSELFAWSDHLADFPVKLESFEQWHEAEGQMIRPQVERVVSALDSAELGPIEKTWRSFRARYLPALEELFTSLRARASELSRVRSQKLHAALDPALPESERGAPLSQKVLHITSSLPGVTAVLVGARRREYVDDLSMVLQWRNLPSAVTALQAARCEREESVV